MGIVVYFQFDFAEGQSVISGSQRASRCHPSRLWAMATKHVFVTGASSGIGLALCKLLVRDHGCYVYLGARNVEKGEACLKGILAEVPAAAGKIEVVQLDVVDNASIAACAEKLKAKGVVLYGLVNNAGVGLAQSNAPKEAVGILVERFDIESSCDFSSK